MRSRRAAPPTDEELARMGKIRELGCLCCWMLPEYQMAEAHHITDFSQRKGHRFTVALCPWHHRGVPFFGLSRSECVKWYGCCLSDGSRPFRDRWGTFESLLQFQERLLYAAGWSDGVRKI